MQCLQAVHIIHQKGNKIKKTFKNFKSLVTEKQSCTNFQEEMVLKIQTKWGKEILQE